MNIIISNRSGRPIYEQIMAQIKQQIAQGILKPGEGIPSMRALARTLHISVITVQKAYETLQQDGFIETVQGKGTFISGTSGEFVREEQLRAIEAHLEAAATAARRHHIPEEKLIQLISLFYKEEPSNDL